jgi:predicted enzyme related to lactoylglutathione lyase
MTSDTPRLFRLNLEVGALDRAASFYAALLGVEPRPQMGARFYIDAGPVTLQVVEAADPHPAAKALYFAVADLDAVHARAAALGCLSADLVHGTPAGEPVVRPWGERSFYADDPWGNPLCFVAEGTLYAG